MEKIKKMEATIWDLGFWNSRFRGLGFGGLGFRVWGLQDLGSGV